MWGGELVFSNLNMYETFVDRDGTRYIKTGVVTAEVLDNPKQIHLFTNAEPVRRLANQARIYTKLRKR
jgi:hypothetical protein